jgi:flavin-dependent dehydrogenase
MSDRYDAVVVGASVAGSAAAHLLARAGARVALVERRPDPDAYKVACTHAVLSSGAPAIERLGVAGALSARGAPRTHGDAWMPGVGWIRAPDDAPRGWGVTRRTLDPLLRAHAADTPGVELLLGRTVTGLMTDAGGRPAGVEAETPDRRRSALRARLVVAADGRGADLARLARVPGHVRPNNRFAYFAYWRGVPRTDRARVWLLDPDGAAHFPNEDDMTLMAAVAHKSRLPEFRADLEGAYERSFDGLADGPDLRAAERVSKIVGALEIANVIRPAGRPGIAFVGDAALTSDPLWGAGLSWALQMAEWLAGEAGPALAGDGDLDAGLDRYRRAVWWRLGPHHIGMSEYASGRRMTAPERAVFRATARDPVLTRAVEAVASRRRSPARLLDPRLTPRFVRGLVSG